MQEPNTITFQIDWKGINHMKKSHYIDIKDEIYQALSKTNANLSSKAKVYFDITIPISDNYFMVNNVMIVISFTRKDTFTSAEILAFILNPNNFVMVSMYNEETQFQIAFRHYAYDGYSFMYRNNYDKLTIYSTSITKTPSLSTILISYFNALNLWRTQSIPSSIWPSTYLQLVTFS